MTDNDFIVRYKDMPGSCGGFTIDCGGFYCIYLNSRLSFERQQLAFFREVNHIVNKDFDCNLTAHQIENIQDTRKDIA